MFTPLPHTTHKESYMLKYSKEFTDGLHCHVICFNLC